MSSRLFAQRPILTTAALALGLFASDVFPGHADEPANRPATAAWTLDEALQQLAFHPNDPYLQYVALQLGKRDGRQDDVVKAIEMRNPLLGLFEDRGRRSRADLFSTFTGAVAVQESLQLDTMRGERPGRGPMAVRDSANPNAPANVAPKNLPDKVEVGKLVGPTVQSHQWDKMLGAKTPDVIPLASLVPEEFWFAEFRSIARLNEVSGLSELWGGHIFTQALGDARSQVTIERIKSQLGLFHLPPKALEALEIEAIAVTGSDLFLAEGSDVTLLVQSKKLPALLQFVEGVSNFRGTKEEGKYVDITYKHLFTSDHSLNVYSATPRPDLHVRSNSLAALKRVLETVVGKTPDGRPVRRLGESKEFQYVRTLMPRGAGEEDGLVYLSDPFIRRLVGPQVKLTERRRVLVYNHLRMIGHAALMFRTEHGRAPKSLEELAEAKCAPGVFGKGDLAHPDGGTYSLSADGMSGVCSKYGRIEALTPCLERLVKEVSGEEAEEYKGFVTEYNQYWRTYFDPIAIRVQVSPKQYRLETLILPLIDNSIYTTMAQAWGGKAVPLDTLPTTRRELGGVWVHFPKKAILDALGPEVAKARSKKDGPKKDSTKLFVSSINDMKQLGLAMHNYHDVTEGFPPAASVDAKGKPLLSWRVAILPYLEQQELYQQFKLDEPWDSPNNKKLIDKMPAVYRGANKKLNEECKTVYLAPIGKDTIFPPDGKKIRIADVTDGTSNTLMLVEANDEAAVVWTKPDDLVIDPKKPLKGLERPARDDFRVVMADGAVRTFSLKTDPATVAAMCTRAGNEAVELPPEPGAALFPFDLRLSDTQLAELEDLGLDLNKLRRFLRDGIGDQVGVHMHDASKLLDFDMARALGGPGEALGGRLGDPELFGLGMLVQFLTGPSSVSIPVKDPKAVDEFLAELDRWSLQMRAEANSEFGSLRHYTEFYRVPFPAPHTIRCHVVKIFGLKWRLYWGRIGNGLYIANRPFILEDIAAAQANSPRPAATEDSAHALLRLRPENWKEVLPGYNLGWAENHRSACHEYLSLLVNVNRGWNDRRPAGDAPDAALLTRVTRFYGVRPFCPDGGGYVLSADGKSCSCSVHGGDRDPRQPAAPSPDSATGRLLKTFGGLSATLTFHEDGLRAVVTFGRKE